MVQAVIKIGSSQYLVQPDQELLIDRLSQDSGEVVVDQVLLVSNENQVIIGKPYVENAKVKANIVSTLRGPKISVSKYKAKSRYRKVTGFRSSLTKIQIRDITIGAKSGNIEKPSRKVPVKTNS